MESIRSFAGISSEIPIVIYLEISPGIYFRRSFRDFSRILSDGSQKTFQFFAEIPSGIPLEMCPKIPSRISKKNRPNFLQEFHWKYLHPEISIEFLPEYL